MQTLAELIAADVEAWLEFDPRGLRPLLEDAGDDAALALSRLIARVGEVWRDGTPHLSALTSWLDRVSNQVRNAGDLALTMPSTFTIRERIRLTASIASIATGPAVRQQLAHLARELYATDQPASRVDNLVALARATAYDTARNNSLTGVLQPCPASDITALLLRLIDHDANSWSALHKQLLDGLVARGGVGADGFGAALEQREHERLLALLELAAHWASSPRGPREQTREWLTYLREFGKTAGMLAVEILNRNRDLPALFLAYLNAEPLNAGEVLSALTGTHPPPESRPLRAWNISSVSTWIHAANPFGQFRSVPDFDSHRAIRNWASDIAMRHVLVLDSSLEALQTLVVLRNARHPASRELIETCTANPDLIRRAAAAARRDSHVADRLYFNMEDLILRHSTTRTHWVKALAPHVSPEAWSRSCSLETDLTRGEQEAASRAAATRATRLRDWLTLRKTREFRGLSESEFDAYLLQLDSLPFQHPDATSETMWIMDLWLALVQAPALARKILSDVGVIRLPTLPAFANPHDPQWSRLGSYLEQLGQLACRLSYDERGEWAAILDVEDIAPVLLETNLWFQDPPRWRSSDVAPWWFAGRRLILESLLPTRPDAVRQHLLESVGRDARVLLLAIMADHHSRAPEARAEIANGWVRFIRNAAPELVDPILDGSLRYARTESPPVSERSRGIPWWHEVVAFVNQHRPESAPELGTRTLQLAADIDANDLESVATVALALDALDLRGPEWGELTRDFRRRRTHGSHWQFSAIHVLVSRLR